MPTVLTVALPNGSLWSRLSQFLRVAGYPVTNPDRTGSCGIVNGIEFLQLDRRGLPKFLAAGVVDAGITGGDLWLNSRVDARLVGKLPFSRASDRPTRWVLVSKKGVPEKQGKVHIVCELPDLAMQILNPPHCPPVYQVDEIDGSEEMYVKHGLADMALLITETGESIRKNDLEIVPGCESLLESVPEIRARYELDDAKEAALQGLTLALQLVIGTEAFVMVTFDLPTAADVSGLRLPADVLPTVSPLTDPAWSAYEICLPRSDLGRVLLTLKHAGARGIVMRDIQGHLA